MPHFIWKFMVIFFFPGASKSFPKENVRTLVTALTSTNRSVAETARRTEHNVTLTVCKCDVIWSIDRMSILYILLIFILKIKPVQLWNDTLYNRVILVINSQNLAVIPYSTHANLALLSSTCHIIHHDN